MLMSNESGGSDKGSECIIWSESGAWLQTLDGDGRKRSSYIGQLSRVSCENFCQVQGLAFHVAGRASAARVKPLCAGAQARPAMSVRR